MDKLQLWRRYKDHLCRCDSVGITLDVSRMNFPDGFFGEMNERMRGAYEAMRELEHGAIANPDENRMVGHYWLRHARLAPDDAISDDIERTCRDIHAFAKRVHDGDLTPPNARKFTDLLVIGIGGSALGPQLVADALGAKRDKLRPHFFDNTDPDGFDRTFDELGARLKSTLAVVISKSGGTPETRNGMLEARAVFERKGLDFSKHAVAVTGRDSQLDQTAQQEGWLARFPMFDWVGGRTSVTAAVGLLPMALQGLDIHSFLDGAARMDKITRQPDTKTNPAARLALMWWYATDHGQGRKDMVVLPYKDRLLLMSRYLQQLVMESLGKRYDLDGREVHQGLTVYGNKGSTDQHAYVQQLRDGLNNFFATFIVVRRDDAPAKARHRVEVDPGVTSGDYLSGFWQGTRAALHEAGRESILITLDELTPSTLGALIAMYERAVGFYASLIRINAYHQPGVEAGKKAASEVIELQKQVVAFLHGAEQAKSAEQIADQMGRPQEVEAIHHVLEHLATNKRQVRRVRGKYRAKT